MGSNASKTENLKTEEDRILSVEQKDKEKFLKKIKHSHNMRVFHFPTKASIFIDQKDEIEIQNYSIFCELTDLEVLTIHGNDQELKTISMFWQIQLLQSNHHLTQITIQLYKNNIKSIEPLRALSHLKHLNYLDLFLNKNQIVSIEPLECITQIKNLVDCRIDLRDNQIESLEVLKKFTSLEKLLTLNFGLINNKFHEKDIEELKQLFVSVEEFDLID